MLQKLNAARLKVTDAKLNVHVVAVIVTAIGAFASVYWHDPIVQNWIATHWWANDGLHGLMIAIPPVLVYFGISQGSGTSSNDVIN